MNFRTAFGLTVKTNPKTLAAASRFSIDKEENILVGSKGTISSTFTYLQQVIEKLFKILMDFVSIASNGWAEGWRGPSSHEPKPFGQANLAALGPEIAQTRLPWLSVTVLIC